MCLLEKEGLLFRDVKEQISSQDLQHFDVLVKTDWAALLESQVPSG